MCAQNNIYKADILYDQTTIWGYNLSFIWSDQFAEVFRNIAVLQFSIWNKLILLRYHKFKRPKGRNKIYKIYKIYYEVDKLWKYQEEIIEKYTDWLNKYYNYNPLCDLLEINVCLEDFEVDT